MLERVKGIEPSLFAWEAKVLPLNDTRIHLIIELGYGTCYGATLTDSLSARWVFQLFKKYLRERITNRSWHSTEITTMAITKNG